MNQQVLSTNLQDNPFNQRKAEVRIGECVENWHNSGIPSIGLSAAERAEVIEDAQSSFMAEFVGKSVAELQAMNDKELVATHYWAMHEATR